MNEKRRQRYMLNKEKDDWPEKREKMLQRKKNAKTMCPQCNILYGSVYLKHHIELRHKNQVLKSGMPVAAQAALPPQ